MNLAAIKSLVGHLAFAARLAAVWPCAATAARADASGPGDATAHLLQELAAEQAAITAKRETVDSERAALKAQRQRLAERLLREETELRRLARENQRLDERVATWEKETAQRKQLAATLTGGIAGFAEKLHLYLADLPGKEEEAARLRRILAGWETEGEVGDLSAKDLQTVFELIETTCREATVVGLRKVALHTAGGYREDVELLSVGHLAFAYRAGADGRLGLALPSSTEAAGWRWREDFPEPIAQYLRQSFEAAEKVAEEPALVDIPIDVTGSLTTESRLTEASLRARLAAGGPVVIPLLLVALTAAILLGERVYCLFLANAGGSAKARRVVDLCDAGAYAEAERLARGSRGLSPRVLAACLAARTQGAQAMEDGIQEQLFHELPRLRRFLSGLAILAAVAPLLGLLGTVTGIIRTFEALYAFGNENPSLLTGGISEALVTTAVGLVVAIPILLCRAVLVERMEKLAAEAESLAASALAHLQKGPSHVES